MLRVLFGERGTAERRPGLAAPGPSDSRLRGNDTGARRRHFTSAVNTGSIAFAAMEGAWAGGVIATSGTGDAGSSVGSGTLLPRA